MKKIDNFFRKHSLQRSVAKYIIRASRGQALISKVSDPIKDMLDGTVYIFAIKGITGILLPVYWIPIIVISKKIFEPIIAWADEKIIGFWKAENHYQAYDLSPYNQELMAINKDILSIVKMMHENTNCMTSQYVHYRHPQMHGQSLCGCGYLQGMHFTKEKEGVTCPECKKLIIL